MSERSLFSFLRPKLLWSDLYRGIEVGRLFIGWTNPIYKARGW